MSKNVREIVAERPYRGMTKEGKWVYGWYALEPSKGAVILTDVGETYDSEPVLVEVEVIPETVGQSTGEHEEYDEKAVIWDGDIMQFSYQHGFIGALQTKEITKPVTFEAGRYWVGTYPLQRAINEGGHVIGTIHDEEPEKIVNSKS